MSDYNDPYDQDYHGNHEQCPDCGNYEQACECDNSTCSSCGVNEPTDDWHRSYGQCSACAQGATSDNQAAAQALSQTIQLPGDRANDLNRRPQLDQSYEDRQEMQRENVHEIMGGYGD